MEFTITCTFSEEDCRAVAHHYGDNRPATKAEMISFVELVIDNARKSVVYPYRVTQDEKSKA